MSRQRTTVRSRTQRAAEMDKLREQYGGGPHVRDEGRAPVTGVVRCNWE